MLHTVAAAGVGHLVHLSSMGAYSPKSDDAPVDENWPTGGARTAGSALLRYGVPGIVPSMLLHHVPVLPLDRRVGGPFNLADDPPVTTAVIGEVLGARVVHVPSRVVRAAMSLAWHVRLQQVDTGWLDMGFSLPLLDSGRARRELGWSPTVDAVSVFREVVEGMRERVPGALRDLVTRGPVGRRDRP